MSRQVQEPSRRRDVAPESGAAGALDLVLAPLLDLEGFVELRGGEGFVGTDLAFDEGEADDERAAGGGGGVEHGQLHRLVDSDSAFHGVERSSRLRDGDDAGRDGERRVEAEGRPVEELLPCLLLPRGERRLVGGPIADEVGLGIFRDLCDDALTASRDDVERDRGEPHHRHRFGTDLALLRLPFGGDRVGERARGNDEGLPRRGADRLAVERHAIPGLGGNASGFLVETLHDA